MSAETTMLLRSSVSKAGVAFLLMTTEASEGCLVKPAGHSTRAKVGGPCCLALAKVDKSAWELLIVYCVILL